MVLALVNDPERVDSHWTGLIHAGQFALFVFDARTHAARDPDRGIPDNRGASLVLCESFAEATAFAEDLVARRPELCCEIYDYGREYGQPLSTIFDTPFHDRISAGVRRSATPSAAL